jgi:hypothetical protein
MALSHRANNRRTASEESILLSIARLDTQTSLLAKSSVASHNDWHMEEVSEGSSTSSGNPSTQSPDEIKELLEQLLQEVRALRQTQEKHSRQLIFIVRDVDYISRELSEYVGRWPPEQELINDDIEQELKERGFKRIE